MSAPEWFAARPDGPLGGPTAGVEELTSAMAGRGMGLADVVHLKLWVPPGTDGAKLLETWLCAYPDPCRRPSVSVVTSDLAEGRALEITAIAVAEGEQISIYSAGRSGNGFPEAAARGDFYSVGALDGTAGPAGTAQDQADTAFARLGEILRALGARPDGVAHMFVWYRGHEVREVVNGPFLAMFPTSGDRPARHSLVRELPPGTDLQIEAMGSRSGRRCSYTIAGTFHGGIGGVPNSLPFGVKCGPVLCSAGTYGRDPDSGEIPDDLMEQCGSAIEHTSSLLHGAGMDGSAVRHALVWLRDLAPAAAVVDAVRNGLLGGNTEVPVQTVASALPGTNLVQIEVVAARGR